MWQPPSSVSEVNSVLVCRQVGLFCVVRNCVRLNIIRKTLFHTQKLRIGTICAVLSVGLEHGADITRALVAQQGRDARVAAAVVRGTF